MALNICLTVAYDGTDYFGWQSCNTGPSIEDELKSVLQQILQTPVTLQAASRTDAGVHARGQVINFCLDRSDLDLNKLHKSLNALLPPSIAVLNTAIADSDFHPTLNNSGKEYHYEICNTPIQQPEKRHFSWHVWTPLSIEKMKLASKKLIGTHDFSAFQNTQKMCKQRDTVREINQINIEPLSNNRLKIIVIGRSFLYKMVRNIVGTLVLVGKGELSPDQIEEILNSKDRTIAGVTAPAHGLTLQQVFF